MPVDKTLAGKDVDELTAAEAETLARQRSEVSLEEYNPREVDEDDKVVEAPDRGSLTVKELRESQEADSDAPKGAVTKDEVRASSTAKTGDNK